VDGLLERADDDQPTIGRLWCSDKNNIEVEFALRDMSMPIGVSEYTFVEALPDDLKGALPTVEAIENDLQQLQHIDGASERFHLQTWEWLTEKARSIFTTHPTLP